MHSMYTVVCTKCNANAGARATRQSGDRDFSIAPHSSPSPSPFVSRKPLVTPRIYIRSSTSHLSPQSPRAEPGAELRLCDADYNQHLTQPNPTPSWSPPLNTLSLKRDPPTELEPDPDHCLLPSELLHYSCNPYTTFFCPIGGAAHAVHAARCILSSLFG